MRLYAKYCVSFAARAVIGLVGLLFIDIVLILTFFVLRRFLFGA